MGQVIHKDDDTVRINQCFQIDTLSTHASLGGGGLQNACKVVQGGGGSWPRVRTQVHVPYKPSFPIKIKK